MNLSELTDVFFYQTNIFNVRFDFTIFSAFPGSLLPKSLTENWFQIEFTFKMISNHLTVNFLHKIYNVRMIGYTHDNIDK